MSVNLTLLIVMGALYACGIYLLLERSLTRVLLGLMLLANATNLLILATGGYAGLAPLYSKDTAAGDYNDPLPQALILTSIVISFAVTAFMLGIIYRTWVLARRDEIQADVEDLRVAETPSFDAEDDAVIPAETSEFPVTTVMAGGREMPAEAAAGEETPGSNNVDPRPEGGGKVSLASLAPLAVVLPILGAALTFLLIRHSRAQRTVSIGLLSLTLLLECLLLASVWDGGTVAVTIGGWLPPWGIVLVVDQFSSLMLVVSSAVSLAVLVYATGQGMADGDQDAPVSIFHPTYLILVAGVSNAFLSGDLFNLYVGFEILLTASYVLMTLGGTGPRIRAGVTYVVVSVVSSVLFLISIAMVYGATGTVTMADLAIKLGELDEGTRTLLHVMLLVAFGIKAAVFPLSFWLPDSYPTAPAPVTAVFAGLLTKVGVYAMVRTETLLFPGDSLNAPLMVAALLTMVVGILGALAQSDIKRLLSFTLVSHIGYMVFGLAMSSVAGLGAAVFYVAHHITIQTSLFLVTGLIERRGGSSSVDRLGGLAKLSPLLGLLFFVPAMNLAGIPPFSGFLGKVGLMQAGIELGTPLAYALVIGGVVTSLLTLLAVARVWNRAFWRRPSDAEHPDPVLLATPALTMAGPGAKRNAASQDGVTLLPRTMVGSTVGLVVLGVALTVFAGPLFTVSDRAAQDMLDRSAYVHAVLGDEVVVPLVLTPGGGR